MRTISNNTFGARNTPYQNPNTITINTKAA